MRYWIALMIVMAAGTASAGAEESAEPVNFEYNYIDVERHAIEMGGEKGAGYGLEASFELDQNLSMVVILAKDHADQEIYVSAFSSYAYYTYTRLTTGNVQRRDLAVGVVATWPLNDRIDMSARLLASYITERTFVDYAYSTFEDFDTPGVIEVTQLCNQGYCGERSKSHTDLTLGFGLRGRIFDSLEAYTDLFRYDRETGPYYYEPTNAEIVERFGVDYGEYAAEVGFRYKFLRSAALTIGYAKNGDLRSTQLGMRFEF